MASALEKLNEIIDTLTTTKNIDGVPEQLADMLSLIKGMDPDAMKEELASAVQKAFFPAAPPAPGGVLTPTLGVGTMLRGGGPAHEDEIVVLEKPAKLNDDGTVKKPAKPAQTVRDLINESIEPDIAMAKLLDKYIRLVIREEVIPESLESGGSTGETPEVPGAS